MDFSTAPNLDWLVTSVASIFLLVVFIVVSYKVSEWIHAVNGDRKDVNADRKALRTMLRKLLKVNEETRDIGKETLGVGKETRDIGKLTLDATNKVLGLVSEVHGDIKTIVSSNGTVKGDSPLRLTPRGKKMTAVLSGRAWAEQESVKLVDQVEGMTPYQIQHSCFNYVRKYEPSAELNDLVEACAYEHGTSKRDVIRVLAIELRDVLLEKVDIPSHSVNADPPEQSATLA